MRNNKKSGALRVILPIAAGIAAITSTAVFFMKRHNKKARIAVIPLVLFGLFCCLGFSMTAYAQASPPPETATTAPAMSTPEPTSKPTRAPVPTSPDTSALTPEGDLTLVDDIQAGDKQIITVVTKSGNYFYIVIDRSGKKENVYFLNLVDESDLMAIIDGKKDANGTTSASSTGSGAAPVSPPASGTIIQQPTEPAPATTTPPAKGGVNTGSIIIRPVR